MLDESVLEEKTTPLRMPCAFPRYPAWEAWQGQGLHRTVHGCSSETLQQDLKLNKDDDLRPGFASPDAIELGAHSLPKKL